MSESKTAIVMGVDVLEDVINMQLGALMTLGADHSIAHREEQRRAIYKAALEMVASVGMSVGQGHGAGRLDIDKFPVYIQLVPVEDGTRWFVRLVQGGRANTTFRDALGERVVAKDLPQAMDEAVQLLVSGKSE